VTISVFELFKVGIGPSSSHTVGPMRAAARFVADLDASGVLARVADVKVELYGSLAATGRGHGTLPAVLLGLEGYRPETIESDEMEAGRERLRGSGKIMLGGRVPIALSEEDIARLGRGNDEFDGIDRLVLETTDELLADGGAQPATWRRLVEELGTHQAMELIFVVGTYAMLAMACDTWGLAPPAGSATLPDRAG